VQPSPAQGSAPARALLACGSLLLSSCVIGDPEPAQQKSDVRPAASPRATRPAAAVPSLLIPYRASALDIVIDGKLDDPAWRVAAPTGRFVNVATGRHDDRAAVQGSALLLYDSEHLYVGFDVSDATVRGGFPADARDPQLWTRDTVEVMIDPDGDGDNRDYYEIQVNPQNLVFDSRFDDYNRPRGGPNGPFGHQSWSAQLSSAVSISGTLDDDSDRDRGYAVELKVPWTSLSKAKRTPPQPGDRWRMNFYAMQNNGGVAWSPILRQGNFHRASRFGRVAFGPRP
jgi:hypothetical protein